MKGRVFKFVSSIYIYFILFILSRIWSYAHVKCALQIINIFIIIIIIIIIIVIIRRFPRSFLCGGPV